MKRPHLLRVEGRAEDYAALLSAAGEAGLRVGWLEVRDPEPLPPSLIAARDAGALRAVAVGGGGTVAVKAVRGGTVLEDLLREHFLGCRLVLTEGLPAGSAIPRLTPDGDGWRLDGAGDSSRRLETPEMVARLRRPRPFE